MGSSEKLPQDERLSCPDVLSGVLPITPGSTSLIL